LAGIEFKYDDLESESTHPANVYNGKALSHRYVVARRFDMVMGCIEVCSGMDYDFLKHSTANSNEHARMHTIPEGLIAGTDWTNVTVEEMTCFLCIISKISIEIRKLEGNSCYFTNL
jgi:hypothetical protein